MKAKVPSSDTGTAIEGTSVASGSRRNTNTTITTRMIEMISVTSTSCSEARIVVDRSTATERSTDGGIDACRAGNKAFMRSTVSMMLAPGCRLRITSTAALPLAIPALRRFSTESTTSPTSDRRTGDPFR